MGKKTKGNGLRHAALMRAADQFNSIHPEPGETADVFYDLFTCALGSNEMDSWSNYQRMAAHQMLKDLSIFLDIVGHVANSTDEEFAEVA